MSSDGRFVVLAWMVQGAQGRQIFKVEVESGAQSLVSSNSAGVPADRGAGSPVLCTDDSHVLFVTNSFNFDPAYPVDEILRLVRKNLLSGEAVVIDRAPSGEWSNGDVSLPSCSDSGERVVFQSSATNLVAGPNAGTFRYHIYARDMTTGQIDLLSRAPNGDVGSAHSFEPAISSDGRRIAFRSIATNLVEADSNGPFSDIFLWEAQTPGLRLISVSSEGVQGSGSNGHLSQSFPTPLSWAQPSPVMSADGLAVAYHATSANLVPDDFNQAPDVFVRNLALLGAPPAPPAQPVPLRSVLTLTLLVLALLVVAARRSRPGATSEG